MKSSRLLWTIPLLAAGSFLAGAADPPQGPYEPTWESIRAHYQAPRWFQGVAAAPGFRSGGGCLGIRATPKRCALFPSRSLGPVLAAAAAPESTWAGRYRYCRL
jgi:hypothetical protein